MERKVKQILSNDVEVTLKTPSLLISLLRVYSALYLQGKQCSTCAKAHRQYYNQISKNGIEMAKKLDQNGTRTCIPAWTGIKFISATGKHWRGDLITDEEATYLLWNGYISESKFKKLPDSYIEKLAQLEIETGIEIDTVIDEITEEDTFTPDEIEIETEELEINYTERMEEQGATEGEIQEHEIAVKYDINYEEAACVREFILNLQKNPEYTIDDLKEQYKGVKTIGVKKCTVTLLKKLFKLANNEITE